MYSITLNTIVQGGSQELLLKTKESIVSNSIFSGPPCCTCMYSQVYSDYCCDRFQSPTLAPNMDWIAQLVAECTSYVTAVTFHALVHSFIRLRVDRVAVLDTLYSVV